MKFTTKNLEETQKIAQDFISEIKPSDKTATVIGLYGDLGAGKTSFTQGVALGLGITETVASPTFVIEKNYKLNTNHQSLFTSLIHIDAYRLEKSDELLHLGWREIISNPKNLILIEWPERVADIMPKHIRVNLNHISENGREIEVLD